MLRQRLFKNSSFETSSDTIWNTYMLSLKSSFVRTIKQKQSRHSSPSMRSTTLRTELKLVSSTCLCGRDWPPFRGAAALLRVPAFLKLMVDGLREPRPPTRPGCLRRLAISKTSEKRNKVRSEPFSQCLKSEPPKTTTSTLHKNLKKGKSMKIA